MLGCATVAIDAVSLYGKQVLYVIAVTILLIEAQLEWCFDQSAASTEIIRFIMSYNKNIFMRRAELQLDPAHQRKIFEEAR